MKRINFFVTAIMILLLVTNCNGPAGRLPGEEDIKISWELITNNRTESSFFTAEFVVENNSRHMFDSTGWVLYFNQLTGTIIPGSITGEVNIDHINGDLYRMTPGNEFRLMPGDTATIRFDGRGWIIKRTDAPQGLFFIFTDKKDKELATVPVKNYTIKPFPDLERVFPFMEEVPLPTPEWQYEVNKTTTYLNADKLQRIIPSPVEIIHSGGKVILGEGLMIHFEEGLANEASLLASFIEKLIGIEPMTMKSSVNGPEIINLKVADMEVSSKKAEAYKLESSPDRGVIITGNDAAGVFYGIQSLMAMVPVGAFREPQTEIEIEAVSVSDVPAFGYRGMHFDLARNFNSKGTILKMIEIMSFYKLNRLHLHLTDDEGWRLEIRELHELTDIGGYRGHSPNGSAILPPAYGSGPFPDPETSYGSGYLTREDFIEILRFAADRHIEVIPEINMPGHARAAIKAMEVRY